MGWNFIFSQKVLPTRLNDCPLGDVAKDIDSACRRMLSLIPYFFQRRRMTVSYTHLRAHETSAHL
eukprot:13121871-Alexandrium_andersonii.AAC.1